MARDLLEWGSRDFISTGPVVKPDPNRGTRAAELHSAAIWIWFYDSPVLMKSLVPHSNTSLATKIDILFLFTAPAEEYIYK